MSPKSISFFFFFLFFHIIFHLGKHQVKANMKTKNKKPQEPSIYLRYLYRHSGMKISHLVKQYTKIAERSIYKHWKIEVNPRLMQDKKYMITEDCENLKVEMRKKWSGKYKDYDNSLLTLLLRRESNMCQDLLMCLKVLRVSA